MSDKEIISQVKVFSGTESEIVAEANKFLAEMVTYRVLDIKLTNSILDGQFHHHILIHYTCEKWTTYKEPMNGARHAAGK